MIDFDIELHRRWFGGAGWLVRGHKNWCFLLFFARHFPFLFLVQLFPLFYRSSYTTSLDTYSTYYLPDPFLGRGKEDSMSFYALPFPSRGSFVISAHSSLLISAPPREVEGRAIAARSFAPSHAVCRALSPTFRGDLISLRMRSERSRPTLYPFLLRCLRLPAFTVCEKPCPNLCPEERGRGHRISSHLVFVFADASGSFRWRFGRGRCVSAEG